MLTITDRQLVYLVRSRMKVAGTYEHGTYNKADPTAYERFKSWVFFNDGSQREYSIPNSYLVELNDVTWGIEIKITNEQGKNVFKERFYLDMWADEFTHCPEKGREFLLAVLGETWSAKKPELDDDDENEDIERAEMMAGWDRNP